MEQCLHSVLQASKNLAVEVFVVDNNSIDGSVKLVRDKFPTVAVIDNKENLGFAKANNQSIKLAKGEYILLLNPDTVIEETTFDKIISFMDAHQEAGGLGVQMIDGKGKFLPESKRGIPSPAVAFYKIVGFSKLFPKSKRFGEYHLGYLDKNQTHSVAILSGAFMLLRKSVIEKVGLLDEAYFMYGEDIDLSYRIILGGYKNYYFHDTRIIHYKGESTKKSSVNYVFVFYRAMLIFARKHFSTKNAKLFSFLINLAIYLRAGVAVLTRFAKAIAIPAFDMAVLLTGLYFIKSYYELNIKFAEGGGTYSAHLVNIFFPIYSCIWLLAIYFSGGYDKPIRLLKIVRGVFVGTAIILVLYSLLPEALRFSRALILFGTAWTLISLLLTRILFSLARVKNMKIDSGHAQRIAIVGSKEECTRVQSLLNQTSTNTSFIGFVSATNEEINEIGFLGRVGQLNDIVTIYGMDEVIFCAKDLPAEQIIDRMTLVGDSKKLSYKIAPPESMSIIGSNSIDTAGDLYVLDINSVIKIANRRNKRVFDVCVALLFLTISPLLMWFTKNPIRFIKNIITVFVGMKSWIGYTPTSADNLHLPQIKMGILYTSDILPIEQRSEIICGRLNLLYAKDYRVENDFNIIRKAFRELGR